jgi:hypothetical protein
MAVFATGGCDRLALGGAEARLFWALILPSYIEYYRTMFLYCRVFLSWERREKKIFCGGRKKYFVVRAHFLLLFASAMHRRRTFDVDGRPDRQTNQQRNSCGTGTKLQNVFFIPI